MQCYYNLFNLQCVLHKKVLILCSTGYLVNKMGQSVAFDRAFSVTADMFSAVNEYQGL